jgi:hypothetical protein
MSLAGDELERLYSEPGVQAYRPKAVVVHPASGGVISALCYNLPEPPPPDEHNAEYATKLRAVARGLVCRRTTWRRFRQTPDASCQSSAIGYSCQTTDSTPSACPTSSEFPPPGSDASR